MTWPRNSSRFLETLAQLQRVSAPMGEAKNPAADVSKLARYFSPDDTPLRDWGTVAGLPAGVAVDRSLRHGQAGRKHIELHQTNTYGRIAKGANKSGKTTWGTVETLCWLMGLHPYRDTPRPPVYGRVVTPNLPHNPRNPHPVRQALRDWCPERWLLNGSWEMAWSPSGQTLTLENGSTLEFVSSNQDSLSQAGAYGVHFVWLDEEMPYHRANQSYFCRISRAVNGAGMCQLVCASRCAMASSVRLAARPDLAMRSPLSPAHTPQP